MSVLGIVRLAQGQVGYFDAITRIHLTIQQPEKMVISGMNTVNLKKAVASGRILLVTGSLDPEPVVQRVVSTPQPEKAALKPEPAEPKKQEIKVESTEPEVTVDTKDEEVSVEVIEKETETENKEVKTKKKK